jgi:hypothetical protein
MRRVTEFRYREMPPASFGLREETMLEAGMADYPTLPGVRAELVSHPWPWALAHPLRALRGRRMMNGLFGPWVSKALTSGQVSKLDGEPLSRLIKQSERGAGKP